MSLRVKKSGQVMWLLAGLAALGAAALLIAGEIRHHREGVTTGGIITAVEQLPAGYYEDEFSGTTPRYLYRVQYRYNDSVGQDHSGELITSWAGYRAGEEVSIQYAKAAPDRSRIAGGASAWGWPAAVVLVVVGLGLVTVKGMALLRKSAA
jgi:hypothetical protein